MNLSDSKQHSQKSPAWQSLAFPAEHGSWGLLLESLVLAFCLTRSWAAFLLTLALIGFFLCAHPLKIVLKGLLRGVPTPREKSALKFAIGYGLGSAFLLLPVFFLTGTLFWVPLVLAFPLACFQFWTALKHRERGLWPQLSGGLALNAACPAIFISGGWQAAPAFWIWVLLAVRTLSSVVSVREIFRLRKRGVYDASRVRCLYLGTAVLLLGLCLIRQIPWLAVTGYGLIFLIMMRQTFLPAQPENPRDVGFRELLFGILHALFILIAYL